MNTTTKSTFVVLCAAAVMLAAFGARADKKTYHASFCQAANGSESDYSRSEYRITKVSGSSTSPLLCPIVHDVFDCSGIGGCVKGMSVKIRVYDYHTRGDVSCTLSARNYRGSGYWWSTDSTSLAGGYDTLSVSGNAQWGDFDNYILKCVMPVNNSYGYTKIYNYLVNEYD